MRTESKGEKKAVVRAARLEDLAAILALERATLTAAHWREDDYRRLFEDGGVARLALVAEDQGHVAGFIVTASTGAEWELENIVVGEAERGRGLGSRLMQVFLEIARQREGVTVFLEVRESNRAARELYRKWGFEEKGRRKAYYLRPEEDAVVYRLDLGTGVEGRGCR